MKHILSIIMLLFASSTIYGQFDNEIGSSPGAIEWSDPVYNDFFNSSCPQSMAKSAKLAKIITKFYQNDPIWGNYPYGHCPNTDCSCGTFGAKGCYLTCISMMLTNSGDYIDPWNLNQFTFFDNCYYDQVTGCDLNANMILDNRPLRTLKGCGRYTKESATNFDLVKVILNKDGFVVAKVNGSGTCSHFILIYDWETINGIDIFYTADPSSVTKRDLSQYTKCQFRYYIPRNNSQVQDLILNGTATKIKQVLSGERVIIEVGSTLKSTKITQNTTTDCTKQLWVVKNDNGQVIDQLADADNYTFSQYTYGRYYVSYAISNENGFDGESIEIIVGDGSSGGPIVVDGGSGCSNVPPTCGDGKCDNGEYGCESCAGDCGDQYVDQGFRINDSFDDVVYLCSKDFAITPIKGFFKCGTETEHHFCWLSLFTWANCPYFYANYYVDVIECNADKTEKSIVYNYGWRADDPENYGNVIYNPLNGKTVFDHVSSGDMSSILLESTYYKIVLKTYFDETDPDGPHGWISSYKYIYILPPITYNNASSDINYLQSSIFIQDKTISGNVIVKAKKAIYIRPNTRISANFNASIDTKLSIACDPSIIIPPGPIISKTLKSAGIDSSNISNNLSNTNDILLDLNTLNRSEESNISIYPNPNNGSFTVLLNNDAVSEISVINMFGQEVCYIINKTSDSSLSISLSNHSDGIYIVKLKGKQKTYIRKIIVETK